MQGETIMSVPSGVTRIVFGGNLDSGEVWQCGYWIQGATPSSNAVAATLASLVYGTLIDATSGPINVMLRLWNSATSGGGGGGGAGPAGGAAAAGAGRGGRRAAGARADRDL